MKQRSSIIFNPWLCFPHREVFSFLKLSHGTFVFAGCKTKVLEKVWKKGVGFGEGKKDLSSKGLFPLPDSSNLICRPLAGTAPINKEQKMLKLDFEKCGGLIPAIAQDWKTNEVLMLAYINEEAWNETLKTGHGVYFSRSRQKLWHKGESSGNVQIVHEILVDCDEDTVIFKVEQIGGAACHTGHASCFFRKLNADGSLTELGEQIFDPEKVYGKDHK